MILGMARKIKAIRTVTEQQFPAWLAGVQKELELSITEFALELGCSRQFLSILLSGERAPGPKMVRALKPHGLRATHTIYEIEESL